MARWGRGIGMLGVVAAWAISACEEGEAAREETSGGVSIEPLPEPEPEEPQPPQTEPVPEATGDEASGDGDEGALAPQEEPQPPQTEPLPDAAELRVRVTNARCDGEPVRGEAGPMGARVRRSGETLRITLDDLRYYCQPAPRFEARVAVPTLIVHVMRPAEGVPVARCVCDHDVTLTVTGVPASVTQARFVDVDGDALGTASWQ